MGLPISVMGMVLTAMPISDYDKRITILTKERGKITAFAKGARRPGSQLLAATNPFAFGEFELFEGRSSYNLTKASIQNYFRELVTSVFECMHCHKKENLSFFSVKRGGIFCAECAGNVQGMKILDSTRYTMQYIISTPVEKLYSFTVSDEVLKELKMIMKEYMAFYVHHEFKSLQIFG